MSKEKTIVITAHGQVINNKFKPSIDIVTTCKLGEPHSGSLIEFNQVHIFDKPEYLYKYVLKGNNYLNSGSLWKANEETYDVQLTPIKVIDPVKRFSWQKPYITEHLTKLCRYELWDNPLYKAIITPFNINSISLADIHNESVKIKDLSLFSSWRITTSYDNEYTLKNQIYIGNHQCSLTYNKNRSVNIIEYENIGIFGTEEKWNLSDFIVDIDQYSKTYDSELTGAESIVLKACLS
jgi:hypothetical protein